MAKLMSPSYEPAPNNPAARTSSTTTLRASKKLILMSFSICLGISWKSKSKKTPPSLSTPPKFKPHAYFAPTLRTSLPGDSVRILILQFIIFFLFSRCFIEPSLLINSISYNHNILFSSMTGTSNNLTNPYYGTDAQQQAYQQPMNQQPNNINININHRNVPPPPPPSGGGLRVNISFGDAPIDVRRCSRCCSETGTIVNYKYGSLIWIMCIVLFCFSVCLFWVPFCIDDWKDKEYRCANCSTLKGFRKGRLC